MEHLTPAPTPATTTTNACNGHQRRALPNPACVVCGAANPNGLHLSFRCSHDEATAEWTPTSAWESFQGVIHGGILTTVLDEAMSKAVMARGCEALTAELRVRFRRQVSPGITIRIHGRVVERRKRRILAEAALTSQTGDEYAHAWATFLIPPGSG